jgi:predicted CXXCH cytochrome family protein
MIPCENCHGAAFGHPEEPPQLAVDRSRHLCLRCHAALTTPGSGRSEIPGIDPRQHNPDSECSDCHNPHHPNLAEM